MSDMSDVLAGFRFKRSCQGCGEPLLSGRVNQLFCNGRCRSETYLRRQAKRVCWLPHKKTAPVLKPGP